MYFHKMNTLTPCFQRGRHSSKYPVFTSLLFNVTSSEHRPTGVLLHILQNQFWRLHTFPHDVFLHRYKLVLNMFTYFFKHIPIRNRTRIPSMRGEFTSTWLLVWLVFLFYTLIIWVFRKLVGAFDVYTELLKFSSPDSNYLKKNDNVVVGMKEWP